MKIDIKHYDVTYSVELSDECTTDELLDAIINLVDVIGFQPSNIEDWIKDKAYEYKGDNS